MTLQQLLDEQARLLALLAEQNVGPELINARLYTMDDAPQSQKNRHLRVLIAVLSSRR